MTKAELYTIARDHFKVFVEGIIGFRNQPFHNDIDDNISNPDNKKMVVSASRGHGKSAHLSVAFPLWLISNNHNLRILLVSSTAQVSKSFLSEIIGHIDRNEEYGLYSKMIDPLQRGVIPRMKNWAKMRENWSGDSIVIDRDQLNLKDPTINAVGLFGSIVSKRADVIICDDVVNQENSATETQRKKTIDWIYTTVLPVLVPGGRFIYLGNTWHQDDLVARLMKDPQFDYKKKMPAIISESKHPELWERWAQFMMDETFETADRRIQAQEYYLSHKTEMDDGVKVLWPDRYPYSDLYLMRLANPYAFARMYQCFTEDTLIRVSNGLKKIKDVRVGDMVITHKGRFMPVIRTMKNEAKGKILSIKVQGFYHRIRVTMEHPLLTPDGWKEARDLLVGDVLLSPRYKGSGLFNVGEQRARIYGWYLAEGSIGIKGRAVTFSLATKETKNIKSLCDDLLAEGFVPRIEVMKKELTCTNIRVCSKMLADELWGMFGKVKGKHIDPIVFDMPDKEREEMLMAYLKGDGHRQNHTSFRVSSVCIDLSDGIARVAESLGYKVTKRYFRPRSNSVINGRVIKTNGFDHVLNIYVENKETGDFIPYQIENISNVYYYNSVYNLEVAEDNSYSLVHFVAHNCDPSDRPDQRFKDSWLEAACKKGAKLKLGLGKRDNFDMEIVTEGVDLAISEDSGSDDTAMLILDKVKYSKHENIKTGDIIVRDIIRGKFSPNEVKENIKMHYEQVKPDGIRVETVGYQEAIQRDLDDIGVPVRGYKTGGEKKDPFIGINSIAIYAELGKLVLPFDNSDPRTINLVSQLVNEMRAFPDGHTGDSLMALWFAFSEMRDLTGNKIIVPNASINPLNVDPPNLSDPNVRKPLEKKADLDELYKQEERMTYQQMMGGAGGLGWGPPPL